MSKKRKDANLDTPLWEYVEKQGKSDEGGGNNQIQCTICNYTFFGSYTRVKAHLLRILGQGVKICDGIDPDSFETLKKLQEDSEMRVQQTKTGSHIPLPGVENYGTVIRKGDKAYGNLFNGSARDKLDHSIARYFFGCGVAFNNIRSPLFRDMIQCAANSNIAGYIPPSAVRLSTKLLQEEKENVETMLTPIKSGWKRTGVSIVSDGWSDNNSRPLINFMGASSSGPVFLKAVDTSGNYKDAAYLAGLFKNTIEEDGVKNVVQLITDNAPVCKAAAVQVETTFKHIFWTPCVAHTLNLALKDLCECKPTSKHQGRFEEFQWMQDLITEARAVKIFVANHSKSLTIYKKYATLQLLSYGETRFATNLIMLLRLVEVKSSLSAMVVDRDWKDYRGEDVAKALLVKNRICDDDWWEKVSYLINLTAPIIEFLRFTDTDKPSLHKVYDMWDTMIERVRLVIYEHEDKNIETGSSTFYDHVHEVLVRRWNKSNNPLICLAHCLNPEFYSDEWIEGGLNRVPPHRDEELSNGRNTCFERLFTSTDDRKAIKDQYGAFSGCSMGFSSWISQRDRNTDDAASWWKNYGASAPLLAKLEDRLMNQPCTASSAERNWSTYSQIQNAKRNKLDPQRAEDLVYVHSSLRLLSRKKDRYTQGPTQYWDVQNDESSLRAPTEQELANLGLAIPSYTLPPCGDSVDSSATG